MATTTIPGKTILTCDCCGEEQTNFFHGCRLGVERAALDFQGQPVANASVYRDLCSRCTDTVVAAINEATANKGRPSEPSIPHQAVCMFKDGDQWCAVFGDFVNLQESLAGFGPTYQHAIDDLHNNLQVQKLKLAPAQEGV